LFALVQRSEPIWNLVYDICMGKVVKDGVNVEFRMPTGVANFNCLAGDIPEAEVISLLCSVKNGDMTLIDMAKECTMKKKCRIIQSYMITDLETETWAQLAKDYPAFATETEVNQWIVLSRKKGAFTLAGNRPVGWEEWILSIERSRTPPDIATSQTIQSINPANFKHFTYKGSTFDIILGDVMTLRSLIPEKKDFRKFVYFISKYFRFYKIKCHGTMTFFLK